MRDLISSWIDSLRIEGHPDEWESKNLLRLIGLNVPSSRRIMPEEKISPDEFSFPLVLKVCDPDILHKTDQGGVELNVTADNFSDVLENLRIKFSRSPILAETMCRIEGTEFILGGLVDPVFGPAVMAGAGGVLTELYKDVSFRLCPCSRADAVRMLNELKISPVLNGYRGSTLELGTLAEAVARLSEIFVLFDGRLNQIDINPMVYTGENWTALDCVVILKD